MAFLQGPLKVSIGMSDQNIGIWFLKEVCLSQIGSYGAVATSSGNSFHIQKPERSDHRPRNAWRSGPPSDWCLLTAEPGDWEDQLHGEKVQDTAVLCHRELWRSVAKFYTECVASEDWPGLSWSTSPLALSTPSATWFSLLFCCGYVRCGRLPVGFPLSSSTISSFFHSRLKIHLFHKSFPS